MTHVHFWFHLTYHALFCWQGYYEDVSEIGGADYVMVNRLDPGEEQTVTVMQQAPKHVRKTKLENTVMSPRLLCMMGI